MINIDTKYVCKIKGNDRIDNNTGWNGIMISTPQTQNHDFP